MYAPNILHIYSGYWIEHPKSKIRFGHQQMALHANSKDLLYFSSRVSIADSQVSQVMQCFGPPPIVSCHNECWCHRLQVLLIYYSFVYLLVQKVIPRLEHQSKATCEAIFSKVHHCRRKLFKLNCILQLQHKFGSYYTNIRK